MALAANDRGQYGSPAPAEDDHKNGLGGILLLLGLTVGIYAFSPGARHFYKHGHLPLCRDSR